MLKTSRSEQRLTSERGLSLIELVVAMGLLAVLCVGSYTMVFSDASVMSSLNDRFNKESIRNVVRISLDCAKTVAKMGGCAEGQVVSLVGAKKDVLKSPYTKIEDMNVRAKVTACHGGKVAEINVESTSGDPTKAASWAAATPIFRNAIACRMP